jgi:hypothetical protein
MLEMKCNAPDQLMFENLKKCIIFVTSFEDGVVAQMVEQRTENPCVTGSIPVDATSKTTKNPDS